MNGLWEGSGNVICLDVLRALTRAPKTLDAFCASRLFGGRERAFDTLPPGVDGHAIVDRVRPAR